MNLDYDCISAGRLAARADYERRSLLSLATGAYAQSTTTVPAGSTINTQLTSADVNTKSAKDGQPVTLPSRRTVSGRQSRASKARRFTATSRAYVPRDKDARHS